MKTAALRTLSLTLVFTVVIGVCLRHRVVTAAAAGGAVTAGEFVVDPPTLINLGFEWFIDGDDNRNASVDVSYRKQGDDRLAAGAAAAAAAGRAHLAAARSSTSIAPNMFAGSILDLEPDTAYEARFVLSRSRRRAAARRTKTVTVRTRPEPKPAAGGDVFHVYPPGFKGAEDRAGVRRADVRLQPHLRRHRLGDGRPAAREGRATRSSCTPALYKYNRYEYTNDAAVNRTVPLDGTYYLTADGTPEKPIVDQGRRRRRGDLRRRRQLRAVRRQGRRLQLLRRAHVPEHRHRDLGRHAVHRRLERADGEALPVRGRRRRRLHQLLGLEQLLHRRQLLHRPQRSRIT